MVRLPFEFEAAQRLHDDVFETILSMLTKPLEMANASLNLASWPRWGRECSGIPSLMGPQMARMTACIGLLGRDGGEDSAADTARDAHGDAHGGTVQHDAITGNPAITAGGKCEEGSVL